MGIRIGSLSATWALTVTDSTTDSSQSGFGMRVSLPEESLVRQGMGEPSADVAGPIVISGVTPRSRFARPDVTDPERVSGSGAVVTTETPAGTGDFAFVGTSTVAVRCARFVADSTVNIGMEGPFD